MLSGEKLSQPDPFEPEYWGAIDEAASYVPKFISDVERVYITDGVDTESIGFAFDKISEKPDSFPFMSSLGVRPESFLKAASFTNRIVSFEREVLTALGSSLERSSHRQIEQLMINSENWLGIKKDSSPHNFREGGIFWTCRYETQSGLGIILPNAKGGHNVFGLKRGQAPTGHLITPAGGWIAGGNHILRLGDLQLPSVEGGLVGKSIRGHSLVTRHGEDFEISRVERLQSLNIYVDPIK